MGRTLTPEQEIQQLRDTIREAHEILNDLRRAMKEAKQEVTRLVTGMETIASDEIRKLANHLTAESNRMSAELNTAITEARDEVWKQLSLATMELDSDSNLVRLHFHGGQFDDQVPLPHPEVPAKGPTR